MTGAISQPRQSRQFLFLLDEKSTVVPVRLAGEQSGGKRNVSYGDARSNSERAAPSALAGGFRLLRSSGIDRLDAPARAAGSKTRKHTFMGEVSEVAPTYSGPTSPRAHQLAGASCTLRRSGAAAGEIMNLIIVCAASRSFETVSRPTLLGQGRFTYPGTGPTKSVPGAPTMMLLC